MRRVTKFLALVAVAGLISGFGCTKAPETSAPAEEKPAVEEKVPAAVEPAATETTEEAAPVEEKVEEKSE